MKFLPPSFYVKVYYEYYTGKKLNLQNPVEFNEKIQWLKVYYKNPILNQLVDKYEVRSFVEKKIGAQYLNKLIGVYYKASEVNIDSLPNSFVIKGAHGYNFNLIVKDKSSLNRLKASYLFRKWLSRNQYYRGGLEWAYKDVRPKLVAEEFLSELDKEGIDDFKFFCFGGNPKVVQLDVDRGVNHRRCYYNTQWEQIPITRKGFKPMDHQVEPPKNFEKMLDICRTLSKDFPFVRVDLYNLDGRILFGEMTFYPGDGRNDFYPDEYNKILGDYMVLPTIPKNQKYITGFA
ncbi:ATP-grasp fold amidoligase family protein [Flagellimonas myxillae]|uniref:ATP-grasp fold amidoligase family protein n=1 Tax=Flagellimonas myxillae TaxID=2942214 RepID=UPI00201E82BC|nr:ATP-grasp fold amidoligase family protein [Muricauda myxillae]MCL6265275.1 glycosyltransferase [Muricauda myxillae]